MQRRYSEYIAWVRQGPASRNFFFRHIFCEILCLAGAISFRVPSLEKLLRFHIMTL